MSLTTENNPIMIGSEVTPTGSIYARLENGDFQPMAEGERYTVAALGEGFAILKSEGSRMQLLAQVAGLKVW